MPRERPNMRSIFRSFVESLAAMALGQPARVVSKSEWERLERLAYRHRLEAAERSNDIEFLRRQLIQVQLTQADLDRLARYETPIERWPDEQADLFAPETAGGHQLQQ